MHSLNAWNMLHLRGRQIILALLTAFLPALALFAQPAGNGNYNYFDFNQKPYYFGITLALNNSRYEPFRSSNFVENDSILRVESAKGPGFNLGIITNLKIGEHFDFRFLPTLSFAERSLTYDRRSRTNNFTQRRVESVFVEMPFHLRYKSAPYRDLRLFAVAGVKYAFDVASESRLRQSDNLVRIAPNDFALEYGVGIQFFMPYFIFSPEIKFSRGIGNILLYNKDLQESTVIEKLLSRGITFSLHFEG
jgi:hypothetical protein